RMPDAMGVRRQTVEHPFGTLKAWMGATHFLTRTLDKVRTEMSLHVLAYNLKRMIRIFGVGPLMAAIRTLSVLSSCSRQFVYLHRPSRPEITARRTPPRTCFSTAFI